MHGGRGGGRKGFDGEVPVGDRIERIGGWPVETQRRGGGVAVDGKGRSGQGCRTERRFVQPPAGIGEAAAIAGEHLDIGHEVVAEGDGLGGLKVGEARHDDGGAVHGFPGQRPHEFHQQGVKVVDGVADPQLQVGCNLIVTGAGGMQPARRRADQLCEAGLDVEMDVLERARELERTTLDLSQDRV